MSEAIVASLQPASRAREYWKIKAGWHSLAKDQDKARDAKLLGAETYVKQAEEHVQGEPPSYTHASTFLQHAIEAFRRVGKASDLKQELHLRLLEYQQKSVSELRLMSESFDITEIVGRAVEQVRGKPFPDAIMRLSVVFSGKPFAVHEASQKAVSDSIFSACL
jgi:hypothetical protein